MYFHPIVEVSRRRASSLPESSQSPQSSQSSQSTDAADHTGSGLGRPGRQGRLGRLFQYAANLRMAVAILSLVMENHSSSGLANGMPGTSGPANRVTGASRSKNAASALRAANSAQQHSNRLSSYTINARLVFATEVRNVAV